MNLNRRHMLAALALAGAFPFKLFASSGAATPLVTISGYVIDRADGNRPKANVPVLLARYGKRNDVAFTDATGFYSFKVSVGDTCMIEVPSQRLISGPTLIKVNSLGHHVTFFINEPNRESVEVLQFNNGATIHFGRRQ